MKVAKYLAGAGLVMVLAAPTAWTQTVVTEPATSTTVTTTTTTTVPAAVAVNPDDPVQFPNQGVGMANPSHEGGVQAAMVDQQIAVAKAAGQDVSAAETQEIIGQADLKRGLNSEASEHFDAALRSIGVLSNLPDTQ